MIFNDGHPDSWTTSLFYMRMQGGRFYRADGTLIGTLRDLPFRAGALDRIYRYRLEGGRAWPMDVGLDGSGSPVVVYTRTGHFGERFFYATFGARGWTSRLAAPAGGHYGGYGDGGASLRHEDPSWVALAANAGHGLPWHVRLLHTADGGASWTERPVPQPDGETNFRPVFPRGVAADAPPLLEWAAGRAPGFRDYRTRLMEGLEAPAGDAVGLLGPPPAS
jgi:hypothetical protein